MYFLTTANIDHPVSCEPIVRRMTILTEENIRMLDAEYGIDSIPCIICRDMHAVESITREMMHGRI